MDISVVIPLLNEEESLPELTAWIKRVMDENRYSYEIILIDDGSSDRSWEVIEKLHHENPDVKGIKFRRNYGKSAALHVGFGEVQGNVVITMDADLQDNPEEIPEFFRMITEEKYDLVSGWKKKRYDPVLSKNIPSKFYNWIARRSSGIKIHDFNCGLKAYRKQLVKSIEVYGEMHRYIPIIAKWAGFKKIGEKVVKHQERKYGETKFGFERFIRGPLDLLSVIFIAKFSKRPMHFFGILGTVMFIIGLFAAAWLGISKLIAVSHNIPAPKVVESPYFFLSLTTMIIGTQLFMAGFLAELFSRNSSERNKYLVDKKIV
ncbi:glycosyltransferase family 2 protein [Mangrovibacterium diazotrophicum]|uniref:Glycosyltransferase involved in cell wall biosynthesis n=1 Tax=Mangrovibacterium diazotrophicum TaxID=1261403 RepID=A0A419VWN4_9BACT|nr:glycosyltransferase family 2 protein [Mangrovibacterium diazotrophicum]RKD86511.1 glycosyltransferase involved in cell wall biosynthesis [Mangrovibacterium diazotrophicum]